MRYWMNLDAATERRLNRERRRYFRMKRAEVAAFMKPLGFDFDPDDPAWTKRDAWDEYTYYLVERCSGCPDSSNCVTPQVSCHHGAVAQER